MPSVPNDFISLLLGLPFVRFARWTEERLAVDKRPANQRPGLAPHGGKPNPAQPV